jgi:hypothetical protein
MALELFNLKTLSEMDGGRIRDALDVALRRIRRDLADRPADKRPRKVRLEISLRPVAEGRELRDVVVAFDIAETIPKLRSREYTMIPGRRGLFVNELSPDDPRQRTIDEVDLAAVRDAGDEIDDDDVVVETENRRAGGSDGRDRLKKGGS